MASRAYPVNESPVKKSYNLQFRFWLNIVKDDESVLADELSLLKSQRQFTQTIRDGVRLVLDLRAGKTDVLFELFPWVRQLAAPLPAPPAAQPRSAESPAPMPEITLEVKKDKDAGKKATANFIRSMNALNPPVKPKAANEIRKLAGAEIKFEVPELEELDLLEIAS
jgi:hypothetical protein